MIKIEPSGDWNLLTALSEEWPRRVEWFMFEFAKQYALKVQKRMMRDMGRIKGPKDYRRRLIVAEMRGANASWFALAVKARAFERKDAQTSLLYVTPRFDIPDDPSTLLQARNPWTVDTLPFVPSERQALITVRNASEDAVRSVTRAKQEQMDTIISELAKLNLTPESRVEVMKSLKISDSPEKIINDLEFNSASGKHWGPALRWARIYVVKRLLKSDRLVGVILDPNNRIWVRKKHLKDKIKATEVRTFYRFQERLIKNMPPS